MTDLTISRRIRGNVHGTVDVSLYEDRVMAHPYMQRLRRIKQLAFLSYVFPGATHSRFEHSLGVMQLAGMTWTKLRTNQKRLATTCALYDEFAAKEMHGVEGQVHGLLAPTFPILDRVLDDAYVLQALRLAGFLHDLGHPPFSHSGEVFMPSWQAVRDAQGKDTPGYFVDYLDRRIAALRHKGQDPRQVAVRHEVMTLAMTEILLTSTEQAAAKSPQPGEIVVRPRDVMAIISPEIGVEAGSRLAEHGLLTLCHELISGEVDIDRMDYLLRDSRECGVVYGIFDATRILDSLCVYLEPKDQSLHLAISFSGLAAFEDYLRARHSMYLQLYFHKTSVAAEAMFQRLRSMLPDFQLPPIASHYAALDEYNIEGLLVQAGKALPVKEQPEFMGLVDDLLRGRRLWKRVFEVAGKDLKIARAALSEAAAKLKALGIPFEQISSSSALTNFRPRARGEPSRNYLRLIKKDANQFPRVVPIEDHSSLIEGNVGVHIARIYVPDALDVHGHNLGTKAKKALIDPSA